MITPNTPNRLHQKYRNLILLFITPSAPFSYNTKFLLITHLKPTLIPPSMEEEINTISHSIEKLQIPPPNDKIPDELLQTNHDRWTEENSIIISLYHGQDLFPTGVMKELRRVWHPTKTMEIAPQANNLFAIRFEGPKDKARVEDDQPWCILNHLVLMNPFSAEINAKEVVFTTVPLQIGFKGLDVEHLDPKCVAWIAKAAGKVESVIPTDCLPRSAEGYRAKVLVEVSKPLVRTFRANTLKRGDYLVEFTYIRLPTAHCTFCDTIGYFRTKCPCKKKSQFDRNQGKLKGKEIEEDTLILELSMEPMGKNNPTKRNQLRIGSTSVTDSNSDPEDNGPSMMEVNKPSRQIKPTTFKPTQTTTIAIPKNPSPTPAPLLNEINTPHLSTPIKSPNTGILSPQTGENGQEGSSSALPIKGKGTSSGRPRGRPKGSKTINRKIRKNTFVAENEERAFQQKRRRSGFDNSDLSTPYYPNPNPTNIELPMSQIIDFMFSPFMVSQLTANGFTPLPNPTAQLFNPFTPFTGLNPQYGGGEELHNLGAQMFENQRSKIDSGPQASICALLENNGMLAQRGDDNDNVYATTDHLGVSENRTTNREILELSQSEINLMHAMAISPNTNQVQELQNAATMNMPSSEAYNGEPNGPPKAN